MQTSCTLVVLGAGYLATRKATQTEEIRENNLEQKCSHDSTDEEDSQGMISNEREVTKAL